MIVKCLTNKLSDLPIELHEYALTQADDDILDITPELHYLVYGVKEDSTEKWFFVHTDEINAYSFWWMPADLYEIVDDTRPKGWKTEKAVDEVFTVYPSLFEDGVEEAIVDGQDWAIQKYENDIQSDASFPNETELAQLNEDFYKKARQKKYESDLKLARERGYEFPEKLE